jgi:uncharacterized membrane protein
MNGRLRKIIRQDAKQALSGKWLTAIIIWFILALVMTPGSFTWQQAGQQFFVGGNGISIFLLLLSAPLFMGAIKWYLSMLRREEPAIEQVFSWFTKDRFLPSLMVRLFFIMVRIIQVMAVMLVSMLCLIPLIAVGGFSFYAHSSWRGGFNFMPFAPEYFFGFPRFAGAFILSFSLFALVLLTAIVISEWFVIRYSAVSNIVADNPKIGIGMAIHESCAVMEGNGWKMIRFYLSFIGWALLVPVTFGLILLYLIPYFTAARLLYIEYFRDMYAKRMAGAVPSEGAEKESLVEETGAENSHQQGQ